MNEPNELETQTNAILEETYLRISRIEPLLRRFSYAMADLEATVPANWATQTEDDVVEFGSLTRKQFDYLVCLVEDLARNRPINVTVMRSGPTLFDPGPPSGPVVIPAPSTVHHVVVPR